MERLAARGDTLARARVMRIGVVSTSYPRWPGDAAGGFVEGHAAYLRAGGAAVDVLAAGHGLPAPAGLFYGGGAPEALEQGGTLVSALGFSARMLATVALRSHRWDAIAAHWLAPSAIAAALAPRRVPLLAIAHGGDVHLLARTRLLAPVLALLVARDARIVFVSAELRRFALSSVPRALAARVAARSIVQAMGVDDARTAQIASTRRSRPPSDIATLVILARLVPVKSVDVAIAAMQHVRTPVRLVIAGDGPLRASLTAQAVPVTGSREVTFTGWLDADARDELLARADAVLVTSAPLANHRTEGAPLAAREALAAGIPLIASATGGLVELASHGATLVPPRDPRALAAAIDSLLARGKLPSPPRTEFGWCAVGAALDEHWRRAYRYAPAPDPAHLARPQWSSRPAAGAGIASHSRDLNVT